MNAEFDYEETTSKSFDEYFKIVKRRWNLVFYPTLFCLIVFLSVTLLYPSTYRSQAIILIEEQDVPAELVRSTITSFAVQRIEEIKQRIMTISNIVDVVDRFELYTPDERQRLTRTEIAKKFRESVVIEPISADVIDPRSGRPTQATIAFRLSFDGRSPAVVSKVTNELVTLYLNENIRERSEQSASTSEFLENESRSLDFLLKDLEKKISRFKDENQKSLPELQTFNLSSIERHERELSDINTRLQHLETRSIQLASELSSLSPYAPTTLPNGKTVLNEHDRLKALQAELRIKSSLYHSSHPDVIRLEREIAGLQALALDVNSDQQREKQLENARKLLAEASQRYEQDHPEIERLSRVVAELHTARPDNTKTDSPIIPPDNPAYILLATQLDSVKSEIDSLNNKRLSVLEKISEYEAALLKAPAVEKDYQALLRDYQNARKKYSDIKARQTEAELGRNLEQERKGERFTLIQPPEIPEKPISPNRILFSILSVIAALGIGVACAGIAEFTDPRVYGVKAIEKITNTTPLAAIELMVHEADQLRNRKRRWFIGVFVGVLFIAFVVSIHVFYKPLDVIWFVLLRKFGFI